MSNPNLATWKRTFSNPLLSIVFDIAFISLGGLLIQWLCSLAGYQISWFQAATIEGTAFGLWSSFKRRKTESEGIEGALEGVSSIEITASIETDTEKSA